MPTYQVRVDAVREEAQGVLSLRLVSADAAAPLPCADSGAHVDLLLGDDLRRSYSLYRPSNDGAYHLAVQLEEAGRGGSRFVHERLKKGDLLAISSPKNHFELRPDHGAVATVLVAGGIGITPIYAMLQTLREQRKRVRLLYCARSERRAAFVSALRELRDERTQIDFLFEDVSGRPDLASWLAQFEPDAHYYCCGPAGMIDAFEAACGQLGCRHCFVERFAAGNAAPAPVAAQSYEVELAASGRTLTVPAGTALLDVLLAHGVDIAYSCREGACGSCETRVLAGDIDHRDCLLSNDEKAAADTMFVCVSGCRSGKLVLDL